MALALLETLADFGTVQYYGVHTFTTAIYRTWYGMGNREGAAQISLVLIVIAVALVALERRSRGRARFAIASNLRYLAEPVRLHHGLHWPRIAACALPILLGFVLPTLHLAQLAVTSGVLVADHRFIGDAINSLVLATVAAVDHRGPRPVPELRRHASSDAARSTASSNSRRWATPSPAPSSPSASCCRWHSPTTASTG